MSTPDTNYHEPTVREALAAERSSTTAVPVRDQHPRDAAAQATLKHLGYTYEGGEQWKPPLGKKPDFDLIDSLRAENAERESTIMKLTEYANTLRAERDALLTALVGIAWSNDSRWQSDRADKAIDAARTGI